MAVSLRWRVRRSWLWPSVLAAAIVVLVSGAAGAALETRTVTSFPRGLMWAFSLITTVGFVGEAPETPAGAALAAFLMLSGFVLLAMVSASLAALFVGEEERPRDDREAANDAAILHALARVEARLDGLEQRLAGDPSRDLPRTAAGDDGD